MISTQRMNLADSWPALPKFDLIFMRNVLIYFDVPTKKQILGKVRQQMRPGGLLLLGGAETTMNLDASFERVPHCRSSWYRLRDRSEERRVGTEVGSACRCGG